MPWTSPFRSSAARTAREPAGSPTRASTGSWGFPTSGTGDLPIREPISGGSCLWITSSITQSWNGSRPKRKRFGTADPIHGHQEGRFFHGYYGNYCYLPLYIFSGEHLLCARLRCSNVDGADGAVEELNRIIGQIRQSWPEVSIIIRADSGFCRDELLSWCEAHQVDYVVGLAKNDRLKREIAESMSQAEAEF